MDEDDWREAVDTASVRDLGVIFQETTQSMYGAKEKFAKFVRGLHPGP